MKNFRRLKQQAGLSLIEVVAAIGIFSVIGMASAQMMSNLFEINKDASSQANIEEIRTELISYLNSDSHWTATLNHPANAGAFACIRNATDCNGASAEFQIFDSAGNRINYATLSTGSEGTSGFTTVGNPCASFSQTGNDQCPYKYVARWQAVCPLSQNIKQAGGGVAETLCRNPLIDVKVSLFFSPRNVQSFSRINVDQLQIHLSKSQVGSDPQKLCAMLNGAYAGGVCNPTNVLNCAGVCAPGDPVFVAGFNPNGTPICDCAPNYNQFSAPLGQVLIGIDNGAPLYGGGVIPLLQTSGAWRNPPIGGS